ncbi:hypothetical protein CEXT_702691 [Caerostris extrusa]|uniref:Uncharacterized protein n=1 Tax=Caerostris extrusa TaxID=172846 RepID=A0AAV4YBG6_CAEEX|nr:hypothetical protein CEXT_702691 [Caerostris extrusa]
MSAKKVEMPPLLESRLSFARLNNGPALSETMPNLMLLSFPINKKQNCQTSKLSLFKGGGGEKNIPENDFFTDIKYTYCLRVLTTRSRSLITSFFGDLR